MSFIIWLPHLPVELVCWVQCLVWTSGEIPAVEPDGRAALLNRCLLSLGLHHPTATGRSCFLLSVKFMVKPCTLQKFFWDSCLPEVLWGRCLIFIPILQMRLWGRERKWIAQGFPCWWSQELNLGLLMWVPILFPALWEWGGGGVSWFRKPA